MRSVLFVCQHGGAKSVIAASHFDRVARGRGLPFEATAAAADDPYDAVPKHVAVHLQRDGFDVRGFKPHRVAPDEIRAAAWVVAIGCDVDGSDQRWDDIPAASEDLAGSVAAIRRHLEGLAEALAVNLDADR